MKMIEIFQPKKQWHSCAKTYEPLSQTTTSMNLKCVQGKQLIAI